MKIQVQITTSKEQEYVGAKYVFHNERDKSRQTQSVNFNLVGYESDAPLAPLVAIIMEWLNSKMEQNPELEAKTFLLNRQSEIQKQLRKLEQTEVKIVTTTPKSKASSEIKRKYRGSNGGA